MRVAVVSDIHGNLMALDAVMTDLERQGPDQIWCGGDIGWGGSWATECVQRVREAGWITIKGNTDIWLTGDPQTINSEEDRKLFTELAALHAIPEKDARWLAELPLGHHPAGSVLLVHGTPRSPFEGPDINAPASEFEIYEDQAQIVVYGHIHKAFVRRLAGGTVVVNTGSVGLPQDGDAATYLLIERKGPDIAMWHRRVEYDKRATVAEAKRTPEPLGSRILAGLGVGPPPG